MKPSYRPFPSLLLTALFCAAGFGIIAALVGTSHTDGFDSALISAIQGMESAPLTRIMQSFTFIGAGLPAGLLACLLAVVLYICCGLRRELLFFFAIPGGSWLLNELLKLLFHRERPALYRLAEAAGYSFPSGHSMAAFSLYGVFLFLVWRHVPSLPVRILLLLCGAFMIVMVGISRIYLGVHYPSDVAAGFMASGCWLAFAIEVYRRYSGPGFEKASARL
ncbi:phosphatase PAP2 family protein [Paenibacillus doosanensis]|uniref:phosphatase PAP2 family protein n=1 Tax=Paenibacillus doosanensis TaxID=1229154 RepID=UPI00217F6092|nr:phosphatase PAP2 family protein [Paenibacillus doosanensis]MCS7458999.1 phosphatase PAP2 family protein [Paenibacillus doosanensis]